MAIAFDKADSALGNSSTTATVALAAVAANETAIIFAWNDSATTFSSVTVNGSSSGVTQIGSVFTEAGGDQWRAYYLYNPSTSSVNYTVTVTGADPYCRIFVELFSGTASDPTDSSNSGAVSSTTLTLSTTVVASNCWLVSAARRLNNGTLSAGTGSTLRDQANVANIVGDSNGTVGTGSQSMSWNLTESGPMAGFIVSIKPSAPSGPANLKSWNGLAKASIKSINGLAIGSIKRVNGLE